MAQLAEAPAVIRETHKQDRLVSRGDREATGWRNVTWPVQVAYENGWLSGGRGDANTRWAAILEYSELHETALTRSGRDSTDMDVITGNPTQSITEAQSIAIKKLISVDSHMSSKDRKIVRLLCESYTLVDAVRLACSDDFKHTVRARVRDALDACADALTEARLDGFRYIRLNGT